MTVESRYDPEAARREALENGSGMSDGEIDRRMGLRAVSAISNPPYPRGAERRGNHGGPVRGFYEGELRDGENPDLKPGKPLTPEERAASARAAGEVRETMLRPVIIAELDRKARQLIPDDPNDPKVEERRETFKRNALIRRGLL